MRVSVGILVSLAIVSCGKLSGDDGGPDDAADASSSSDASNGDAPTWDGGVCDPNRPLLNQNEDCDTALNTICQQWAQNVAVGAYGYSQCSINPVTDNRFCDDTGCMSECLVGQVCASTTATGPRQCIQACAGL
jgi:hypothetical protein